jgi:hypothetical protein
VWSYCSTAVGNSYCRYNGSRFLTAVLTAVDCRFNGSRFLTAVLTAVDCRYNGSRFLTAVITAVDCRFNGSRFLTAVSTAVGKERLLSLVTVFWISGSDVFYRRNSVLAFMYRTMLHRLLQ